MLSCLLDGQYTEASKSLNRKLSFICRQCNEIVILKAGSKNIAHFSHKSDSECNHGAGETPWHRNGKRWVANFYRSRGYDVKFEEDLGNRRTDVLVTTKEGKKTAIEFQNKDQGAILYKRTNDLLAHVDDVVWVFPWKVARVEQRYRATATYGINALYSKNNQVKAKIMFYDSTNDELLSCEKRPWEVYVEQTDFGGGYNKNSRRWCELIILKKFSPVVL